MEDFDESIEENIEESILTVQSASECGCSAVCVQANNISTTLASAPLLLANNRLDARFGGY